MFRNTAIALSVALLSSATMAKSIATPSSVDKAVMTLEAALHKSSDSLIGHSVIVDPISERFVSKYGDDLIPVNFTGKRFITNKEGSFLLQPNSVFMVTDNGLKNASEAWLDLDFSTSEKKWPALPLPEGVTKTGDVFVFTDPTCGYCKQVDAEVSRYLNSGLQVHYIPFPRAGVRDLSNPGFAQWAAAACASEPAKAYHDIAMGKLDTYPVPADINDPCLDVVKEGYAYGQRVGVEGTPFIFAKSVDGNTSATPGYIPIDQLGPRIGVAIKRDAGMDLLR